MGCAKACCGFRKRKCGWIESWENNSQTITDNFLFAGLNMITECHRELAESVIQVNDKMNGWLRCFSYGKEMIEGFINYKYIRKLEWGYNYEWILIYCFYGTGNQRIIIQRAATCCLWKTDTKRVIQRASASHWTIHIIMRISFSITKSSVPMFW